MKERDDMKHELYKNRSWTNYYSVEGMDATKGNNSQQSKKKRKRKRNHGLNRTVILLVLEILGGKNHVVENRKGL